MSESSPKDDNGQRLNRLKAMQARRKSAVSSEAAAPADAADAVLADGGEAAGGQGGGGKRAAILQRLRKFIATPEGGVDQKKAKALVRFVKRQAEDPEAPRHEQAKKAMNFLNNMDPEQRRKLLGIGAAMGKAGGEEMRAGKAGAAGRGAGRRLGGKGAGAAGAGKARGDGAWFDDLVSKD